MRRRFLAQQPATVLRRYIAFDNTGDRAAPILLKNLNGRVGNVLDPARVMQARRMDVHGHSEELVSVAVKFEGEPECYIFTNESYLFPRWQNPSWRLRPGHYRLRVTVYYERGRAEKDFELSNEGPRRDDFHLNPWPS